MKHSIIRLPEVKKRTGLSRSTIYDRIKEAAFPEPVQLGNTRNVGWIEAEIDQWVTNCIEQRRSKKSS